jgi:hypothetical protein
MYLFKCAFTCIILDKNIFANKFYYFFLILQIFFILNMKYLYLRKLYANGTDILNYF